MIRLKCPENCTSAFIGGKTHEATDGVIEIDDIHVGEAFSHGFTLHEQQAPAAEGADGTVVDMDAPVESSSPTDSDTVIDETISDEVTGEAPRKGKKK